MAKRTSHLTHLGPNSVGVKETEKREKKRKRMRGRRSRERSYTFSLDFPTIGRSVSGEARGKVLPRDKSCK